jgi:hypothetical protein
MCLYFVLIKRLIPITLHLEVVSIVQTNGAVYCIAGVGVVDTNNTKGIVVIVCI